MLVVKNVWAHRLYFQTTWRQESGIFRVYAVYFQVVVDVKTVFRKCISIVPNFGETVALMRLPEVVLCRLQFKQMIMFLRGFLPQGIGIVWSQPPIMVNMCVHNKVAKREGQWPIPPTHAFVILEAVVVVSRVHSQ